MASLHQTSIDATPDTGAPAAEFGASLREIRLAHQRELSDVSEDLRIRQVFLKAIEAGQFDALPGPAYAVGFVRAYADYLGLDVEEVVRSFKELGGGFNRQTNLVPPSPVAEGRLPTGSVLLVAGMLAATAYGGWLYVSADGKGAGDVVAALSERIAALVGMTTEPEPPASPSAPAAAPAPALAAAVVQEIPVESDAAATLQSAATDETAAATTAPAEAAEAAEAAAPTAPAGPSATETAGGDSPPEQGDTSSEPIETTPAAGAADSAASSETPAAETPATEPAAPSTTAVQTLAAAPPEPPPATTPTAPQPAPVQTVTAPEPMPGQAPPLVFGAASPVSSAMADTPAEPAAATEAVTEAVSLAPAAGAEPPARPVPSAVAASSAAPPPETRPEAQPSAPVPVSATPAAAQIAEAAVADAPATRQEPPSISVSPPRATTPAVQQTAAVPTTLGPQIRVTVRATANSWVEVRRGDKQTVFSRMMQTGEAVDLPVFPGMTLSTGNAGGIELMIDGEVLPPLGPPGAIRRNVALDAETLLKKTGRTQ